MQIVYLIVRRYEETHADALTLVEDLQEDLFTWRPERGPQCIAWQLWHVARWDDFLAEVLIGRTPALAAKRLAAQVWTRQNLASRWGLDPNQLGVEQGGTGLSEQAAAAIQFPPRQEVIAYAKAAFRHIEEAVAALDDRMLTQVLPGPTLFPGQDEPDTYGGNILIWLEHVAEHGGMMEALRGMRGLLGRPD